jgi:hypothetical protein
MCDVLLCQLTCFCEHSTFTIKNDDGATAETSTLQIQTRIMISSKNILQNITIKHWTIWQQLWVMAVRTASVIGYLQIMITCKMYQLTISVVDFAASNKVRISTPSAASSKRQRGITVTNNTGIVLRLFDGVLF